jgi:hypothetical protein
VRSAVIRINHTSDVRLMRSTQFVVDVQLLSSHTCIGTNYVCWAVNV